VKGCGEFWTRKNGCEVEMKRELVGVFFVMGIGQAGREAGCWDELWPITNPEAFLANLRRRPRFCTPNINLNSNIT
jgi:hypothetical protein